MEPNHYGVVAAYLGRFDVELDRRGTFRRHAVVIGNLAARLAADKEDDVGFTEHAIGAFA